jgi:hypothetical protein
MSDIMLMQLECCSINRSEALLATTITRFDFPQRPYYILTVALKYLSSRGCSSILMNIPIGYIVSGVPPPIYA